MYGKKERYQLIHNYTCEELQDKTNGIITYPEDYNNFSVNWKEIKRFYSYFCKEVKCPLGKIAKEADDKWAAQFAEILKEERKEAFKKGRRNEHRSTGAPEQV